MKRWLRHVTLLCALTVALLTACFAVFRVSNTLRPMDTRAHKKLLVSADRLSPFQKAVMKDLDRQIKANIAYADGYYIGGDPPPIVGVCTDVVIRSYRAAGVNLRQGVQDDIAAHPQSYDITKPDSNIDHRRCRNLTVYFAHHAKKLPVSGANCDWQPGDIVFWDAERNGQTNHVGIIANGLDNDGDPTIVHHWPGMPVSETDGLYNWPIKAHYRWVER